MNSALCLFLDSTGRLWVGTEGGGLYLYDRRKGTFSGKNRPYSIPGDMVSSIEEDRQGNLWLGTNAGLVRLHVRRMGHCLPSVSTLLPTGFRIISS